MNVTLPSWSYIAILVSLLIAGGVGEYFHLLPVGTLSSVFFLVLGLIAPSPAFPHSQTTINTDVSGTKEIRG